MSRLAAALFATALMTAALPARAEDRRVTIVNNTGYTITNFYGSNTGADSWQEDILGKDLLPPGGSVVINFDDSSGYCMFDFRAVFEDGDEIIDQKIDVCTIGTFTYN
ncbi:hypothetical protein H7F16_07510 [Gemmobacter straminiformis]|uniref:Argininosuccinate lyase n=2 Tax=Paragemmobacter straminiformis TaxID=2045119 RepID=A0A842I6Y6_9RHOB|nr:hypothetical protein [Gemmobacter straminiformis]